MPKSNHGTKRKPGRAQWYARRNVNRIHKRGKEANYLAWLAGYEKGQGRV